MDYKDEYLKLLYKYEEVLHQKINIEHEVNGLKFTIRISEEIPKDMAVFYYGDLTIIGPQFKLGQHFRPEVKLALGKTEERFRAYDIRSPVYKHIGSGTAASILVVGLADDPTDNN